LGVSARGVVCAPEGRVRRVTHTTHTTSHLVEPAQGGGARAVDEGVDILLLAPAQY
jgi:hypothetical protein